jgi:Na+-transporting methylmalonyl-CoA/oxaloacetate decarboxylase gamma subunit
MPVESLLTTSIELMLIGMGAVFIILGLLIGSMYLLSMFAPGEEPAGGNCQDDKTIIAAIQSAIHHHRNHSAQKTAV